MGEMACLLGFWPSPSDYDAPRPGGRVVLADFGGYPGVFLLYFCVLQEEFGVLREESEVLQEEFAGL